MILGRIFEVKNHNVDLSKLKLKDGAELYVIEEVDTLIEGIRHSTTLTMYKRYIYDERTREIYNLQKDKIRIPKEMGEVFLFWNTYDLENE